MFSAAHNRELWRGHDLRRMHNVIVEEMCIRDRYYYASVCLTYLSGRTLLADGYRLSFLLMIAAGAMLSGSLIWEISDLLNGCMTVRNLAALFLARRLTDP